MDIADHLTRPGDSSVPEKGRIHTWRRSVPQRGSVGSVSNIQIS